MEWTLNENLLDIKGQIEQGCSMNLYNSLGFLQDLHSLFNNLISYFFALNDGSKIASKVA